MSIVAKPGCAARSGYPVALDRFYHFLYTFFLPNHSIFQIFGQVYGEGKYGGTGIGLAIVRKAAQRMNGEVGLESELGTGCRFWIILDEAKK